MIMEKFNFPFECNDSDLFDDVDGMLFRKLMDEVLRQR